MTGLAVLTANKEGMVQGYASIEREDKTGMEVVPCYPHRDSTIKEGVVALDTADKYIVKKKSDGKRYIFVKGANDIATDISTIEPINIKRGVFEHIMIDGGGALTFNSESFNTYKVGDSILYISSHEIYAIVHGRLYILATGWQFTEKLTARFKREGYYQFTDETADAFEYMNKLFQVTGQDISSTDGIKKEELDRIPLYSKALCFSGVGASVYENRLLSQWMKQRQSDCMPFGLRSAASYWMEGYSSVTLGDLRNNVDEAFNQSLALEEIMENRIKIFLDRFKHRVQDKKTMYKMAFGFRTYFNGSLEFRKFLRENEPIQR